MSHPSEILLLFIFILCAFSVASAGNFHTRRRRCGRSVICVLYVFFSVFSGIWQTNAEEQITWEKFHNVNGSIPFIVYYPKGFTIDPHSEILPSHVKYLSPENKRLNEYYKWCMVLNSPDESLRVRIASYDAVSYFPFPAYHHYCTTGRELILDLIFNTCKGIWVTEAGEYVIIQGTATYRNGQKALIIVYLGNEDDKNINDKKNSKLYVFKKITIA